MDGRGLLELKGLVLGVCRWSGAAALQGCRQSSALRHDAVPQRLERHLTRRQLGPCSFNLVREAENLLRGAPLVVQNVLDHVSAVVLALADC